MDRVKLVGYIDVPDDIYAATLVALETHIALTRAEPGCISFDVTPNAKIQGRLDVNELFINQMAFDHHQERTSQSTWAEQTKGLKRNYAITKVVEE